MAKRIQQAWDKFVEKVVDHASTAVFALLLAAIAALAGYFRQAHDTPFYFWLGALSASSLIAIVAFIVTLIQRRRHKAKEQKDKWLHDIADADRQNIEKCVRVERCEIYTKGLNVDPPYLDFNFTVFNGSVFTISIGDAVKGVIVFRNQPLIGSRDIIYGMKNVPRGGMGRFTLRQILDARHAQLISEASEEQDDWLVFDHLNITITAGDGQPEVRPRFLNLMRAITKSGWIIWRRD
jgi:hypothetical protein